MALTRSCVMRSSWGLRKSVAVLGNTKAIKDQLKANRGRFNKNLWDSTTGATAAGWIFAVKDKERLLGEAALGIKLRQGAFPKPEAAATAATLAPRGAKEKAWGEAEDAPVAKKR